MKGRRRALFLALCAVLLGAIGLIVYGENRPLKRTFYGSVKDLLPTEAEVPGWKVEYLPIADTPEMQAKVSEILNYDDAVYAVYTKGTERISIYIAYWTPGKMSERLIAGHTPDVCWVGAGWRIVEAKSGRSAQRGDGADLGGALERSGRVAGAGAPGAATDTNPEAETLKAEMGSDRSEVEGQMSASQNISFSDFQGAAPVARAFSALKSQVSGFDIDAGERRLMKRNAHSEQVAFWHLSGDKLVSYGMWKPKWRAAFAETSDAFGQRGEQIFIRISRGVAHRRTAARSGSIRVATGQGRTGHLFGSSEET